MVSLKDKIVLITGATSGIGQAVALELLNEGCRVVLTGRNQSKIEESILNQKKFSDRITFIGADLQNDEDLKHLVTEVNNVYGSIDILIHSAGIIYLGETATASLDNFDELYRVNVRAPYFLTQAFLSEIIKRRGQLVFLNSTAGLDSWANFGQYGASKHALRAWVESLRVELMGTEVKIMSIFPGSTDSPMQQYIQKIEKRDYRSDRFLSADHLANVIVTALKADPLTVVSDIVVKPLRYDPDQNR